ncbi:L,D-transpeptidase family protein [Acinetobacter equi]|uniref:L,D-transpeptidase catalytic domain protein n=1 Tax=Acinetobacter equi TaxID=1324350 RepID=A0A0N9VPD9_9GAMM|nr:L,D-transpeptidase family protein [Acinetobacter equi]ALH95230.1 L,D-transpeptidase catalytic domain protein [Acinetobacter equi]
MNKKSLIIFLIFIILLISGYVLFQKYNQYLPTTTLSNQNATSSTLNQNNGFPTPLTDAAIQNIRTETPIQLIKVHKKQRIVQLIHGKDQIIREYPMRLGFDPIGHKVKEGDGKTPEGRYTIDWRNPQSAFYKSLHISYPNQKDKNHAQQLGVSPGGDIMIHGSATTKQVNALSSLMTYFPRDDWTWGCIAVRNIDIDEIWKLVNNGIPIEIAP